MAMLGNSNSASLTLFAPEPMTLERALEIVERFPVGVNLTSQYRRCTGRRLESCKTCHTKKGHGPYTVARWMEGGRKVVRFIGDAHKVAKVREAWAVVEAALEKAAAQAVAEETPAQRAYRELRDKARSGRRAPDVATIPILGSTSPK